MLEFESDRFVAHFGPPAVVDLDVGEVGNDFAKVPAFPPIDSGFRKSLDRRRPSLDGVDEGSGADDINDVKEEGGEEALKEKSNELIIDISPSLNSLEISPS